MNDLTKLRVIKFLDSIKDKAWSLGIMVIVCVILLLNIEEHYTIANICLMVACGICIITDVSHDIYISYNELTIMANSMWRLILSRSISYWYLLAFVLVCIQVAHGTYATAVFYIIVINCTGVFYIYNEKKLSKYLEKKFIKTWVAKKI